MTKKIIEQHCFLRLQKQFPEKWGTHPPGSYGTVITAFRLSKTRTYFRAVIINPRISVYTGIEFKDLGSSCTKVCFKRFVTYIIKLYNFLNI